MLVSKNNPAEILIVDDSAAVRQMVTKVLSNNESIKISGHAADGQEAIDMCQKFSYDIIILDIEMPRMRGIDAISYILEALPYTSIIVSSTLTTSPDSSAVIESLSAGATDYLCKPTSKSSGNDVKTFYVQLEKKVIELANASRKKNPLYKTQVKNLKDDHSSIKSIDVKKKAFDAIAIGSSTGGPRALTELFELLPDEIPCPIFVTQHMPVDFTKLFAQHLNDRFSFTIKEAQDGEKIQKNTIYIAPGDFHMCINQKDGSLQIALNQGEKEQFCRPSVNPMLRSLSEVYNAKLLSIILTGMGKDGCEGCAVAHHAGGTILVQNEETSVVWGMPKEVVNTKLAHGIMSVQEIGCYINDCLNLTS